MAELQEARAWLANFSTKFWHEAALSQIDQFEQVAAGVAQRHRLYANDWSSGEITWEGGFGPGAELFVQGRAFAEGIIVTTGNKAYRKGVTDFIIAVASTADAGTLIRRLITAAVAPHG